jgi:hypothetical protein
VQKYLHASRRIDALSEQIQDISEDLRQARSVIARAAGGTTTTSSSTSVSSGGAAQQPVPGPSPLLPFYQEPADRDGVDDGNVPVQRGAEEEEKEAACRRAQSAARSRGDAPDSVTVDPGTMLYQLNGQPPVFTAAHVFWSV